MKLKTFFLLIFFVFSLSVFLPETALCLPPDPGGECDPADPLCPIDSGLTILLAMGAGIGMLRKKQS